MKRFQEVMAVRSSKARSGITAIPGGAWDDLNGLWSWRLHEWLHLYHETPEPGTWAWKLYDQMTCATNADCQGSYVCGVLGYCQVACSVTDGSMWSDAYPCTCGA